MIIKNRGLTLTLPRNLFISIAYWKEINQKKGKNGKPQERKEEEREKYMDLLFRNITDKQMYERMSSVIEYLNKTSCLISPVTKVVITN